MLLLLLLLRGFNFLVRRDSNYRNFYDCEESRMVRPLGRLVGQWAEWPMGRMADGQEGRWAGGPSGRRADGQDGRWAG